MSYWKGLMIAAAIDLVWIMGSPSILAPERNAPETAYTETSTWPLNPENVGVVYVDKPTYEVKELDQISLVLDSLMGYLGENPEDVDAMQQVADLYADKGWWDGAIGPLARAIQFDPERWSLWSALDRAVEQAGMAMITDAELLERAAGFVEAVEMWGHGC